MRRSLLFVGVVILPLAGCENQTGPTVAAKSEPSVVSLVGVWRSPPGEDEKNSTEWGPTQLYYWLKSNGQYELAIDWFKSPGTDPHTDYFRGTYSIDGERIRLNQENAGKRGDQAWKFALTDARLKLEGLDDLKVETHEFVRVGELDWPGQRAAKANQLVKDWDENRQGSAVRGMWRLARVEDQPNGGLTRTCYWFQDGGKFLIASINRESADAEERRVFSAGTYKLEENRVEMGFGVDGADERQSFKFERQDDVLLVNDEQTPDEEPAKFLRMKKTEWPTADDHSVFWK